MILSNEDIKKCMKTGEIKIEPFSDNQIGPASVDLTLDNVFYEIKTKYTKQPIDLSDFDLNEVLESYTDSEIVLQPGDLVLGITKEQITLSPNICGFLSGRSRYARLGLGVHVSSNFMQPGISNHQVLEICNVSKSSLILRPGLRICQAIFARMDSETTKPYAKFGKIAVKQ